MGAVRVDKSLSVVGEISLVATQDSPFHVAIVDKNSENVLNELRIFRGRMAHVVVSVYEEAAD